METSMKFKIVSFNTLSLQKHYSDVKGDPKLHNADVVCLQETCLMDSDKNKEKYNLREFESHFNGVGRGKGIATFYSENFTFIKDIKMDSFQISKIESSEYSILNVYRSNDASMQFLHDLVSLIDLNKNTIICGDLNFCSIRENDHKIGSYLKSLGFIQMVNEPTHREGQSLDICMFS